MTQDPTALRIAQLEQARAALEAELAALRAPRDPPHTRLYHLIVDLAWALALPEHLLGAMLRTPERPLTAEETRGILAQKLSEGYTALPMCDHTDATGICLGHETEEE